MGLEYCGIYSIRVNTNTINGMDMCKISNGEHLIPYMDVVALLRQIFCTRALLPISDIK